MNCAAKDTRAELTSYKAELQDTQDQLQLVDQVGRKVIAIAAFSDALMLVSFVLLASKSLYPVTILSLVKYEIICVTYSAAKSSIS